MFDLHGRVVAVIGGTGVLGGALCEGLGGAGASVAVLGRSRARADERVTGLAARGIAGVAVTVDATDPGGLEAARQEVERSLGPVDVLVNAPGVNSSTPFFEITLEEWHRLLDVNLTSVFLASQVFGRAMVERGAGGSIINFSSASSGPPLSRVSRKNTARITAFVSGRMIATSRCSASMPTIVTTPAKPIAAPASAARETRSPSNGPASMTVISGAVDDRVLISASGSSESPQNQVAVDPNMSRPRRSWLRGRAVRNTLDGEPPPSRTTTATTYARLRPRSMGTSGTSLRRALASESVQMKARLART